MASPGDIYRLAVEFGMPGTQLAYNIFDVYQLSGSCTDAELLTAAASFMTDCYAELVGIVHSNVDLNECRVNKMVWSGTAWIVDRLVGTIFPTFVPIDANDMLPHACAPVVLFPTGFPRRVGKKYIAGTCEDGQDESTLTAGVLSALSDFALEIFDGFTAGTASFIYGILPDTGSFLSPTTAQFPAIMSSQRRRKPGVGV